ncbi:hypothetical protein SAMN05660657_04746 [Geodermatophilus amargosae]|uniref:Uncharacterized protein n=1 Tax=Geodermatophilus amargosae TaxID=1296565 RepID=A0A1I7CQI0_9ACTN|nr:hypothetical protein [Geodermatophilus amargosae]SFU01579.1 hypothetical protein SAMN05660657_04746 [Geodermatophilus amargosae]
MTTWSPSPWVDLPTSPPDPPVRSPARPVVTVYVPAWVDAEEMYSLHVIAALLEDRCPRCYTRLTADEWDETPPAYQWRICALHGYWRRHQTTPGRYIVPLWQWCLGPNPDVLELR